MNDRNQDREIEEVETELRSLDPLGQRWASVIRKTYDMIYNGQETGRYRWDQLMKTEKTHFGTLLEINAQREFDFPDGDTTDFRIGGHQVDAKWSQKSGGWMLPPEVFDEIALVVTADDKESIWSLGLVRVTAEVRREKVNRDKKSQLSASGRTAVRWLWTDEPLQPNILLKLEGSVVDYIFDHRHGTQRTNRLFRGAADMIVHRNAVATVSRQLDHQKRVRYNGGARSALAPEGIVILSGVWLNHQDIAAKLGVDVPMRDEYISVRVVPSLEGDGALIDNGWWRRALPGNLS